MVTTAMAFQSSGHVAVRAVVLGVLLLARSPAGIDSRLLSARFSFFFGLLTVPLFMALKISWLECWPVVWLSLC